MPWVRCAFGHVYLYQSMICSVVSPLPILNSRMLLPWSDYCSRTKSKNPFRARGTFVLRGTFVRTLWPSGVCNEMRWWWDSLVDKGPHCICWSCWTADEQLGRSPAGRGKVRVGCDKNICICICICICWIHQQHPRAGSEGRSQVVSWVWQKIWDIVVTILVEGAAHDHLSPIICHQKFWCSPSSPLMDVGRRLVGFKDFWWHQCRDRACLKKPWWWLIMAIPRF